jgi:hypothetical protein
MKLDEIVKTGLWRLDIVRVKTAVNPLLWLVGLTTPLSVLAAVLIDDRLVRLALLGFAGIPIIVTLIAYFVFMFRDPDRLQSEEYRIRQRAIQLLYRIGGTAEIVDVATQKPRLEIEHKAEESEP